MTGKEVYLKDLGVPAVRRAGPTFDKGGKGLVDYPVYAVCVPCANAGVKRVARNKCQRDSSPE